MTEQMRKKQVRKGTSGVRAFITAASVAATVAGWSLIADADRSSALGAQQPPIETVSQEEAAGAAYLQSLPPIGPLPTLVPMSDGARYLAPLTPTVLPSQEERVQIQASAPTSTPEPQPRLRQVAPPPRVQKPVRSVKPMAVTRSSR